MGLKGKKDSSRRKYPGMGGRRHNPVGIAAKREEARQRQALSDKRTPLEQIARLDTRQCEAKRERARLAAKLKAAPTDPAPAPAADKQAKPKTKAKDRRDQAKA